MVIATETAARSPSSVPRPMPSQTTTAIPPQDRKITSQSSRLTRSRRKIQASSAVMTGVVAKITSAFATPVFEMETRKRMPLRPNRNATLSPAQPMARNTRIVLRR